MQKSEIIEEYCKWINLYCIFGDDDPLDPWLVEVEDSAKKMTIFGDEFYFAMGTE